MQFGCFLKIILESILVVFYLCLVTFTPVVLPAIVSSNHTVSVNGSFPLGQCSSHVDIEMTLFCTEPVSNVLFDGVISKLTGLDGDMWASQLLTLEKRVDDPVLVFLTFATAPISAAVQRIEMVMFNCPQWGVSVQEIVITRFPDSDLSISNSNQPFTTSVDITSCDSLVRVCISVSTDAPRLLTVGFTQDSKSSWVHLAEVKVYNDNFICPPDAVVDATILLPAATTSDESTALSTTELEGASDLSCTSNILPPVITAVATALLATVVFVLVQIAVCCKCRNHAKFTPQRSGGEDRMNGGTSPPQFTRETGTSTRREGQVYDEVDRYEGGVGGSGPTYMEIAPIARENTEQLEENGSYGRINTFLQLV